MSDASYQSALRQLRALIVAFVRLGDEHRWVPTAGSPSAGTWAIASKPWHTREEAIATVVTEAEVHALTLIRSGIEHAEALTRAPARRAAYIPQTLARTCEEHLLRALHYLDASRAEPGSPEDQALVAEIRFDQIAANLVESTRMRSGIVQAGWMPEDHAGDVDTHWAENERRCVAIGWTITRSSKTARLAHTDGRASTMTLARRYLAAADTADIDGQALTQVLLRDRAAVAHGYETGLFAATKVEPVADLPFAALTVTPAPRGGAELAFSLMLVPLSVVNVAQALVTRFGWAAGPTHQKYLLAANRATTAWHAAINHDG